MSAWLRHPDDEPTPRFGGWADDFNTYEEACNYYGVDTPAQIAAEVDYHTREEWIVEQDDLESRGPTFNAYRSNYVTGFDELPF